MKLFLTPHLQHFTEGLSRELSRQGIDVKIPRPPKFTLLRKLSRPLAMNPLSNYDVYHFNTSTEASLHRGDRLLVTEHGFPDVAKDPSAKSERERKALLSLNAKGFPVYTISEYSAKMLRELHDINSKGVIYHGVLEQFMAPEARESMEKVPLILHSSRLIETKKPLLFIEALSLLHGDYRAMLQSDGPLRQNVEEAIQEKGLGARVTLRPIVSFSQLPDLYKKASIYVHTAPREAFGLAILEAMSAGLPVVVPDSGGANEISGRAGIRYESEDAASLAEAISQLMNDSELYSKESRASLERAKEFTWSKAAKAYSEAYSKIH